MKEESNKRNGSNNSTKKTHYIVLPSSSYPFVSSVSLILGIESAQKMVTPLAPTLWYKEHSKPAISIFIDSSSYSSNTTCNFSLGRESVMLERDIHC